MTIRFNLYNQGQKETLIYFKLRYQGKLIANWSTGLKIAPKFWSDEQRAKKTYPGYTTLNAVLRKIRSDVESYYRGCLADGNPIDKEKIREIFNDTLQRSDPSDRPRTFFEFFDYFIKEREKSPKYAYYTVRSYYKVRKRISDFNPRLDWQDLGLSFFFRWTDWLFAQGLQSNYVSKLVTTLKVVLRDARDRDYPVNPDFERKQYNIEKKKTDKVYLSMDEITNLLNLDLSDNYRLDKIRDLMIIACFTGQRFSDFTRINQDMVRETESGKEVIVLRTVKSGKNIEVVIPLHPAVRVILEKYNGTLPKISNPVFNRYVKEVCELAGINKPTVSTTSSGGTTKEAIQPKYELITAHTFRRTFITNNLTLGVPYNVIMAATGITKVETLMLYDRLEKEKSAEIIQRSQYFDGSSFLRKAN